MVAQTLMRVVQIDNLSRGEDPDEHINRPLMQEHVRTIADYLEMSPSYILPAITLNASEPIRAHLVRDPAGSTVRYALLVLPASLMFQVTDGQHRIKALERAMQARESLRTDGIPITIVQEGDITQLHQDFVDCAQSKPVPPSLLTAFNTREPLPRLVRELARDVPVFRDRIEMVGKTVGKSSTKLFTLNQVRNAAAELLTGDSRQNAKRLKRDVGERLEVEETYAFHKQFILDFFENFVKANEQWLEVATGADPGFDKVDAARLRDEYVHFTGTGLVVIGNIGYAIRKHEPESERESLISRLGKLDWRRSGELWRGNIVTAEEKVLARREQSEIAIAKVKQELGLELTDHDTEVLDPAGTLKERRL